MWYNLYLIASKRLSGSCHGCSLEVASWNLSYLIMSFQLQCNITLQDCATLYPSSANPLYQFGNGSCVIDPRLDGEIARCGWPGAPCFIIDNPANNTVVGGSSNCAKRECWIRNRSAYNLLINAVEFISHEESMSNWNMHWVCSFA